MKPALPVEFSHKRLIRWVARLALSCALLIVLAVSAQTPRAPQRPSLPRPSSQPGPGVSDDEEISYSIQNEKLLRAANADRQRSMVSDTAKLLRLVHELNAEIARTNPNSLNNGQLQAMAQIEKLAHNVKDKMSTSVRGVVPFRPPPMPPR